MRASLKVVFKYYKYASAIFLIGLFIYIVIDDWVLIRKVSGFSEMALATGLTLWFTLAYFIVFSVYFWLLAIVIVFVYRKIIRRE